MWVVELTCWSLSEGAVCVSALLKRNVAEQVSRERNLSCCVVCPSARCPGSALWFKCNFILWENTLTKGNSCLGVMDLCIHEAGEGFYWSEFLLLRSTVLWGGAGGLQDRANCLFHTLYLADERTATLWPLFLATLTQCLGLCLHKRSKSAWFFPNI